MRCLFLTLITLMINPDPPVGDSSPKLQSKQECVTIGDIVRRALRRKATENVFNQKAFFDQLAEKIGSGQSSLVAAPAKIQWQYPFQRVRQLTAGNRSQKLVQKFMERVDNAWVKTSFHSRPAVILQLDRGGMFYIIPVDDHEDAVEVARMLGDNGLDFRGVERRAMPTPLLLPYGGLESAFFSLQGIGKKPDAKGEKGGQAPGEELGEHAVIIRRFVWVADDCRRAFASGYVTD